MAESFRKYVIGALLFGLFLVAMIGFAAQVAVDNNANSTILNDPLINSTFNSISDDLEDSQSISQNQSISQDENEPVAVFDFLQESIVGAGRIFKGLWRNIYEITVGFVSVKLGLNPVITATFTTIILIIIIFLTWKMIKTGS